MPVPALRLGALVYRVRRTVLVMKFLYSIDTGLQLQVDVRVSDFVVWRAVAHDQKGRIIVGLIQEVMTIASACRECDAGAWPDRLSKRPESRSRRCMAAVSPYSTVLLPEMRSVFRSILMSRSDLPTPGTSMMATMSSPLRKTFIGG